MPTEFIPEKEKKQKDWLLILLVLAVLIIAINQVILIVEVNKTYNYTNELAKIMLEFISSFIQ